MGLDSVALLIAVEESFDITIPNHEAETIVTVDDLFQAVLRHLASKDQSEFALWNQLRRVIIDECAIEAALITPDARIVADLGIN